MLKGLFLPLMLLLSTSACAQEPQPDLCGGRASKPSSAAANVPALTGRVMDQAQLLSPAVEASLTRELEALEQATSDQLVVVTVPTLEDEPIERLGLRLGNTWAIGQEKLANGVLLIVAPNDRKVRIEVGCGLEGLLTDERASAIIHEQLIPRFREGHFEDGIGSGVSEIVATLKSNSRRPMPKLLRKVA